MVGALQGVVGQPFINEGFRPMTRSEHVDWCKERAREYLDSGDAQQAITSILSDMGKHDETKEAAKMMGPIALMELMSGGGIDSARRFIEGFN